MEELKRYFKDITDLYPYQRAAIENILTHKNTLAIVPTGGGKSLVYQLSAMKFSGMTLVISPLKALMIEQVEDLKSRGINAIAFNSELTFEEQRKVLRSLKNSNIKLMYVSPERLQSYFFRMALAECKIEIPLIVIDEAHCISQWGVDFRPDYSCIRPFIEFLKRYEQNPTILSLTATLGAKAREEIKTEFEITHEIIETNIIRDNLILSFKKVEDDKGKLQEINNFINEHGLKKVIVYLYSIDRCEKLSSVVPGSAYFHSRMEPSDKLRVLREFRDGSISILFATTAFGMGINIPDIDSIIHHDIPTSVEEYYQHVGRGARNKKKCPYCKCLLLWSDKNFDIRRKDIKRDSIKNEELVKAFELMDLNSTTKATMDGNTLIHNDGKWGSVNLKLIYRLFEKHGICSTVGEVNGKIDTIEFKTITPVWKGIIDAMGRRRNYLLAETRTGIPIEDMIRHVYEQELAGNIKKLPASEQTIFLVSNYDSLPDEIANMMLAENSEVAKFKVERLEELQQLIYADDPYGYIASVLGVPYSHNKN